MPRAEKRQQDGRSRQFGLSRHFLDRRDPGAFDYRSFCSKRRPDGALPESDIASSSLLIFTVRSCYHRMESFLTLLPIITAYLVFQIFVFKQKRRKVIDIARGLVLTYVGLVIFLLGVNGGFMAVGAELGKQLASMESRFPVLFVSLLLGLTTVLAEPAVHVLTHQVEEVTGGSVRRSLVLVFLSIAVGLSIFMSTLRVLVPGIQLWMYLLPGFTEHGPCFRARPVRRHGV